MLWTLPGRPSSTYAITRTDPQSPPLLGTLLDPHMLRHTFEFYLANQGYDLG